LQNRVNVEREVRIEIDDPERRVGRPLDTVYDVPGKGVGWLFLGKATYRNEEY
jgi:hypothetical protein